MEILSQRRLLKETRPERDPQHTVQRAYSISVNVAEPTLAKQAVPLREHRHSFRELY
jgi:hypothetical protein